MAPTPDQKKAFADRLKPLRAHSGLTQKAVVEALEEHGGYPVTDAAYSEWERGLSAPDGQNASALERLFGEPEGSLGSLLGFRGDDPGTNGRLSRLEDRLGLLEDRFAQVERLDDRLAQLETMLEELARRRPRAAGR